MSKPLVDLVVLNHNRPELVFESMESLVNHTKGVAFRIVTMDNGSVEPVAKAQAWWVRNTNKWNPFRKCKATSIQVERSDKNLGFSGGNNFAAARCDAPYILFINNDAFPKDKQWLSKLLFGMEWGGYAAIGPTSNYVIGLQDVRWNNRGWPVIHDAKMLSGFCLLIRRDVFEAIGRWDERFFSGDEDLDLSIRLRKAGYKLGIHRGVFVHHDGFRTIRHMLNDNKCKDESEWYGRSRQTLWQKWGDKPINDLYEWESLRTDRSKWRSLGVMPNGEYHTKPGKVSDQLEALDKLHSRYRADRNETGLVDELHPRRYAIGDDTAVVGFA